MKYWRVCSVFKRSPSHQVHSILIGKSPVFRHYSYTQPSEYDNPILLSKGEKVKLGELSTEENWKNWIWAENTNLLGGWVPIQILEFSEDKSHGIVLEDYSAKELNLDENELLIKIKSLNGWSWVKKLDNSDQGWIPDEAIKLRTFK